MPAASSDCSLGGSSSLQHTPPAPPDPWHEPEETAKRAASHLVTQAANQLFSVLLQRAQKRHRKVKGEFQLFYERP